MGRKGISAFLVEKGTAGLNVGKTEKKMGLARSKTTELRMEDLFVPVSNRLGEEGEGFPVAMSLLDGGRIGIAAQGLGLARASVEYLINNFKERQAKREELSQSSCFALADLGAELEAARCLSTGRRCLKIRELAVQKRLQWLKYLLLTWP
jgi:alkylation response protein AidB-like acyl-CoA dehydrogenase